MSCLLVTEMLCHTLLNRIGDRGARPAGREKQTMSRVWRRVAPIVAAGGLIAASGAIPAEAASAVGYGITIAAKVKHAPITNDKFVLYKGTHGYGSATIHGQISGATAGDIVTLQAKPFGAAHFAPVGTATLTTGSQPYSFTVKPIVATAYEAQVTTGTHVDATSATQTVYVLLTARYTSSPPTCSPTKCTVSLKAYVNVPASAYKTESAKHTYLYVAIGHPQLPKVLTLTTNGKVSRARKIKASEFELSLTWYIKSRNGGLPQFAINFCEKDTESRDGMSLPGHHGCGDRTVSVKQANIYLG
jgi:hypothetical protein